MRLILPSEFVSILVVISTVESPEFCNHWPNCCLIISAILGSTLLVISVILLFVAWIARSLTLLLQAEISGCCESISITVSLGTLDGGASPTNSTAKSANSELDSELKSLFSAIFFSICFATASDILPLNILCRIIHYS